MKHAFSLLELIFIVVILGAVASVVVHKLNTKRSENTLEKAKNDIQTIIRDFSTYYMQKGKFGGEIRSISSVELDVDFHKPQTGVYKIDDRPCVDFEIMMVKDGKKIINSGAIKITAEPYPNAICKQLLTDAQIISSLSGKYICSSGFISTDNFELKDNLEAIKNPIASRLDALAGMKDKCTNPALAFSQGRSNASFFSTFNISNPQGSVVSFGSNNILY